MSIYQRKKLLIEHLKDRDVKSGMPTGRVTHKDYVEVVDKYDHWIRWTLCFDPLGEGLLDLIATAIEESERDGKRFIPPGTISHGTMRSYDLLGRFLAVLGMVDAPAAGKLESELPANVINDEDHEWWRGEGPMDFIEEIMDKLDEHACPGYRFGSHEGDGSDYGIWPLSLDSLQMDLGTLHLMRGA